MRSGSRAGALGRSAIRARRWLVAVAASMVVPTRWGRAATRISEPACIAARTMSRCGTSNTRESRAARRALRERAADAYRRLGAGRCAASDLRGPAISLACRARCAVCLVDLRLGALVRRRWLASPCRDQMPAAHGLVRRVSRGSGLGALCVAVRRYRYGRETLPRCRRASCVPIAVRAVLLAVLLARYSRALFCAGGCVPARVRFGSHRAPLGGAVIAIARSRAACAGAARARRE